MFINKDLELDESQSVLSVVDDVLVVRSALHVDQLTRCFTSYLYCNHWRVIVSTCEGEKLARDSLAFGEVFKLYSLFISSIPTKAIKEDMFRMLSTLYDRLKAITHMFVFSNIIGIHWFWVESIDLVKLEQDTRLDSSIFRHVAKVLLATSTKHSRVEDTFTLVRIAIVCTLM